jgi:uncharacterized protein (DUF885 family)
MRRSILVILLLLGACQSRPVQPEGREMSTLVDDYFNALFEWSPSFATGIGFHQYDTKLEDFSAAAYDKRIRQLKDLQMRVNAVPHSSMSSDEQIDAEILQGQINAELLELETLQTWRKNPMNYIGLPGGSIDSLMKRNFAPAPERLHSVIARLKSIPAMLDAMKQNVHNPPHEFTDLAVRMSRGSVGFFKGTVADWAKDAAGSDGALRAEFEDANAATVRAFDDASWKMHSRYY